MLKRVHLGHGMKGRTPWEAFQEIYGLSGVDPFFPVVLLDDLAVLYTTRFLPEMEGVGQHLLILHDELCQGLVPPCES